MATPLDVVLANDAARRDADREAQNRLAPDNILGLFPASLTARDVCRQLNVAITRRTYAQSQLERLVQAGELVKVQRGRSEVIYSRAPSLPPPLAAPSELSAAAVIEDEEAEQAKQLVSCGICIIRRRRVSSDADAVSSLVFLHRVLQRV